MNINENALSIDTSCKPFGARQIQVPRLILGCELLPDNKLHVHVYCPRQLGFCQAILSADIMLPGSLVYHTLGTL